MSRNIRAVIFIAAVALVAACSDDDAASDVSSTTAGLPTTAVTRDVTAETAPSTSAAVVPVVPACRRRLEALKGEPTGTAMTHVPRLSALVAAIEAAGVLEALDGPGPITVFAPVNAAFEAIPPTDLDAMLTDSAALDSILLYHAVADELSSAELAEAGEVETIEGQPLSFTGNAKHLSINGGEANVICGDIATANGTIHLIDAMLTPPPSETNVAGGTMLFSVDLASGAATRIGPIGHEVGVIGMAVGRGAGVSTVYGLTDVPELITFDAADPTSVTASVPITGVAEGSSLLAIDVRPADGAIVALSDASVLYTIDPATGRATAVGTGINPPVQDPGFGFDVDPVGDRIRVDVATGQNLSVDPTTGEAVVSGDLAYGRGDANAGATPRVVAAAYSPSGELFAVDAAMGTLVRQVPDEGTLTTVGSLGVDVTDGASLDIAPSGDALLASPG